MSNYTKATNFATKDALTTGNPLKTLSGTELDDEFNAIQVATNTKADASNAALTGVPVAPTAASGTSTTQVATTAFVTAVDSLKAPLASPALTGTPTAPTAAADTSTTQVATTAFVTTEAALKADLAGAAFTGAVTTTSTFDGVDISARDAVLTSTTTTAGNAMPKAGGAFTGAVTTNSTFDGVDIATRDGVLTSTTTTAGNALPKAGGTMTGALDISSTTLPQLEIINTVFDGYTLKTSVDNGGAQFRATNNTSTVGMPIIFKGQSEYARFDSVGRLAVGTISPQDYNVNADDLVIASSGKTGATLVSDTNDQGYIYFADGTATADNSAGGLVYNHSNETLFLRADEINVLALDDVGASLTGDMTVSGGVVFGDSGGTGTSTSNKLEDYEEGTWIPSVGGNATYYLQSGVYTRIGNMVTVHCRMTINTLGTGSSSVMSGLPFPPTHVAGGIVPYSGGLAVSPVSMDAYIASGLSNIYVYGRTGASASSGALNVYGNGTGIHISITYQA